MGRKKGYKAPEGLVKQKKSKNWYIKTRVEGKLIYKSTKTSDLRQAELILAKVKVALLSLESQVREVMGKSIPFGELMERYLSEVSPLKRSQKSDVTNAKPLLVYFGDRKIDLITTQDIYKYQDWRKSQKARHGRVVSGTTVNREVALLSHAFKKAIRWGYLDENPAQGIEGFPESRHLADIMDVLYHTAQRSGRILGLKWKQINLKDRTITFEQVSKT
jgi:site-specific recombinase XerD